MVTWTPAGIVLKTLSLGCSPHPRPSLPGQMAEELSCQREGSLSSSPSRAGVEGLGAGPAPVSGPRFGRQNSLHQEGWSLVIQSNADGGTVVADFEDLKSHVGEYNQAGLAPQAQPLKASSAGDGRSRGGQWRDLNSGKDSLWRRV